MENGAPQSEALPPIPVGEDGNPMYRYRFDTIVSMWAIGKETGCCYSYLATTIGTVLNIHTYIIWKLIKDLLSLQFGGQYVLKCSCYNCKQRSLLFYTNTVGMALNIHGW